MAKRKRRGRPKGSSAQKKVNERADHELVILDNPLNVFEVDPGMKEEPEEEMPKKKGRGRPKGSRSLNCQESVHGNLNSHINPSNMVEVGPRRLELQDARAQNCQQGVDGNLNSHINPSNTVEVGPRCEESENADISVTPKIKRRGLTRGWKVQMKRQQSPDGKLDVLIHPTRLVAVGPGRKDFITDLSVIVRQNARLNVCQWKKVPQSSRDIIVENILNNWRLPDTDMVRKAILDEAGRLYRNWRNRLHDYYLKFETKEAALKHVPDDTSASDWQILVDYFSSPSFEMLSTINKANRAKLLTNHTCGQKSFQAVSYDARDPVTGKEPDLQTLWRLTRTRANGEWVDEASREVNDKVAEQINERLPRLEDSEDGMETIEPEIISTAFKTVVGKKSYMQGFSAGLRSSSSSKIQQLQAELEAQKRETENAQKECNEVRAKLVEVESQLEEERRKREEIETRLLDRQKEMLQINSHVQTAIQSALSQYCIPTTEAAETTTSSKQKRKIAELEEQLHEAENVITDIRSELIRHRMH